MSRLKRFRVAVIVLFIVLLLILVAGGAATPKIASHPAYIVRQPISIHGETDLNSGNGVTSGSGNESDPYIIEGWTITPTTSDGISISDTRSFIIVRNVAIDGSYHNSFYGSSYRQLVSGISLVNTTNVVIETTAVVDTLNGIMVKSSPSNESNPVLVRSCTILSCGTGVHLVNSSYCRVERNVLRDSSESVGIEWCDSVNVSENEISSEYVYYRSDPPEPPAAISIQNSQDVELYSNEVGGYSYDPAITVFGCVNVTATWNSIWSNQGDKIEVSSSSGMSFKNNILSGGGRFHVSGSSDCEIAFNRMHDGSWSGISVDESTGVWIHHNDILRWGGIYLTDSTYSDVDHNIITDCDSDGVDVHGMNIKVANNVIARNSRGVSVSGSFIEVVGNVILDSSYSSFDASWASNTTIRNNTISSPFASYGTYLNSCVNVTITGCDISGYIEISFAGGLRLSDNELKGDHIWMTASPPGSISIVHNSIYEISVYNSSSASATWDDGYPLGGNYWSTYVGVDQRSGPGQNQPGGDGIGDTPYMIDYYNADPYPLMAPVIANDTTPPVTRLSMSGLAGDRGWFTSEVNCSVGAWDNKDTQSWLNTYHRLDSGEWSNWVLFKVEGDGEHLLEYYSTDLAGNVEPVNSIIIRIDTQPPRLADDVKLTYHFKNTLVETMHFRFIDSGSGYISGDHEFAGYGFEMDSFDTIPFVEIHLSRGNTEVHLAARDLAGNVNWSGTLNVSASRAKSSHVTSIDGPYGPWYNVGLVADILLLLAIPYLTMMIVYGPEPPRPEKGVIDKEEVVDGYPKYIRKL